MLTEMNNCVLIHWTLFQNKNSFVSHKSFLHSDQYYGTFDWYPSCVVAGTRWQQFTFFFFHSVFQFLFHLLHKQPAEVSHGHRFAPLHRCVSYATHLFVHHHLNVVEPRTVCHGFISLHHQAFAMVVPKLSLFIRWTSKSIIIPFYPEAKQCSISYRNQRANMTHFEQLQLSFPGLQSHNINLLPA